MDRGDVRKSTQAVRTSQAMLTYALSSPLSSIGLPYYRDQLLSAWPSHLTFEVGNPPTKIDPHVLATMSGTEFGGYAPNPRKTRRNQIENTRSAIKSTAPLAAPKFLSEKARESGDTNSTRGSSDAIENSGENSHLGVSKAEVPLIYRNVEIKYSRFGVDDFDFEYVLHTTV